MTTKPDVKKDLGAFSSRYKAQWAEFYKGSSNFSESFSGTMDCTDCFAAFQRTRIQDAYGFGSVKGPDGKPITKKLNAADDDDGVVEAREAVKTSIAEALKFDDFDNKLTEFNDELNGLNSMLSSGEHPGDIGSYLLKMKGNAVEAINQQHTEAKSKINNLFTDEDFKTNLQTSLGCGEVQLEAIKAEMLAALDKSKQDEMTKLEKALEDSANQLFMAARLQFHRLYFLGSNYERSKSMRADMERQMNASDDASSMEFNFSGNNDSLKKVDVSKLTVFTTVNSSWVSGASITKTGSGYSVQLNWVFETDESTRKKIASMVAIMLAEGKDTCTLKINNKDPKQAEKDARLAYEAAVEAGMDPKKITIEVNGEVKMKYNDKGVVEKSDLFKGHEQRLQYIQSQATKIADSIEANTKGTEESTRQIKQKLQDMRSAPPTPDSDPDTALSPP